MLTAAKARAMASGGFAELMASIEEAAQKGEFEIVMGQDLSNDAIKTLRDLGYSVTWSRPMLQHTISW